MNFLYEFQYFDQNIDLCQDLDHGLDNFQHHDQGLIDDLALE